eukprot:gene11318-23682_t
MIFADSACTDHEFKTSNPINDEFRNCEKEIRKFFRNSRAMKQREPSRSFISEFPGQNIIDFHSLKDNEVENISRVKLVKSLDKITFQDDSIAAVPSLDQDIDSDLLSQLLIDHSSKIYKLNDIPDGFFVITNALSTDDQIRWAGIAVEEYSRASHTNLTNLKALAQQSTTNTNPLPEQSQTSNLWTDTLLDNDDSFSRFKPLRWASLGYHYDWTARMYKKDLKSPFPENLALLCKKLANSVDEDITAEAAIVNYYPIGACMSGHLDDAEHALEEPIVSISLGCPAIFLIGGTTKDIKPIPILIRSGDVIIMSKASRCLYHGVAIVLSHSDILDNHNNSIFNEQNKNEDAIPIIKYLQKYRININVRRVASATGVWEDKCGTGSMMKLSS